tara:strand:+ start:149 stop:1123 length:975 start_codon:yes stop_codon:yes gene_type:complete
MSTNQWHKKESPVQGITGLWGGVQGSLLQSGSSNPEIGVEMWGGGGGAGAGQYEGSGGAGGYAKFTVELPAGTYYATAGQNGVHGTNSGYNSTRVGGGGKRSVGTDQGGSAGGFSGIWANNTYSGTPIAMVGGGGGSDWVDQGGNGGGVHVNGGTGWDQIGGGEFGPNARPIGATLTAGGFYDWGNSSPSCNGEVGVQLRGGNSTCTDTWAGGGGGGGYWGGGAGTGNIGNGGTPGSGGSGYLDQTLTSTIVRNTTANQRAQNVDATQTYYQNDSDGNAMASYGGGAARNQDGGPGRVKIYDSTFTTLLHDFSSGTANGSFTVS